MKDGAEEVWRTMSDQLYKPDSPPFLELINFSDSEGVIVPDVSKKLYNDFVNYENTIKQEVDKWFLKIHPEKIYGVDDTKWFLSKYEEWKKVFENHLQRRICFFSLTLVYSFYFYYYFIK